MLNALNIDIFSSDGFRWNMQTAVDENQKSTLPLKSRVNISKWLCVLHQKFNEASKAQRSAQFFSRMDIYVQKKNKKLLHLLHPLR